MKIIVIARTRNEEENIERFCKAYQWADKILVADGGSRDNTVSIAKTFENVEVRDYSVFIQMDNGIIRTPHGSHLNFLIDWAFIENEADWVICDDCDCFPNYEVKNNVRVLMESTDKNYVYITRLYLWKDEGYFPNLSKPNTDDYVPSIWAWKRETQLRFRADRVSSHESHQELSFIPHPLQILNLMPPYALLHCPWQTEEMVERKLAFYRLSGQIKNMQHPLHFGGPLEPLPEWAVE
jgi:glycosyltransferase involved in cell wall biosynthesis